MYCIEKVLNFWAFLVNAKSSDKISCILYNHMYNQGGIVWLVQDATPLLKQGISLLFN